VSTAGDCPRCGHPVDPGRARAAAPQEAAPEGPATPGEPAPDGEWAPELDPVPWHLKLLAAAVALYLGWRAFQGIEWLVHRL